MDNYTKLVSFKLFLSSKNTNHLINPPLFQQLFKKRNNDWHIVMLTHKIHRPYEFQIYPVPAIIDGKKVQRAEMTCPRSQLTQDP